MTMNCHTIIFLHVLGFFVSHMTICEWNPRPKSEGGGGGRQQQQHEDSGLIDFSQEQQHRIPPIRSKKAKRDDIENSNLSATQGLKMVQLKYHMLWPAMGPIYATNPKACCTQVKSYLGCLYLV